MQALNDYITQVQALPPAPRILVDLFDVLLDDEVAPERVVELITFDPGLTAKILQRCNSAVFGSAEPVDDVQEAVTRVGFNEIFRLVAAIIGEQTLGMAQRGYGIGARELWQHSAVSAVAAQVIARRLGDDENVAFTAALLHDIGKLVLSASLEKAYTAVLEQIQESGRSFVEAEKALLGVEHAEVGGRVLAQWRLPERLVRAVWHHHDPKQAEGHERLAACVLMADLVAHFIGYGHGYEAYAVRGGEEVLGILGLEPSAVEALMLDTNEGLKRPAGSRHEEQANTRFGGG